jgi:serine/threonine-protein kinase HipA
MGALEYRPALATERDQAESIQIDALVRLARGVVRPESIAERLTPVTS